MNEKPPPNHKVTEIKIHHKKYKMEKIEKIKKIEDVLSLRLNKVLVGVNANGR